MEAFVVVALIGFALLLAELLLPTGGVLAAVGAPGSSPAASSRSAPTRAPPTSSGRA